MCDQCRAQESEQFRVIAANLDIVEDVQTKSNAGAAARSDATRAIRTQAGMLTDELIEAKAEIAQLRHQLEVANARDEQRQQRLRDEQKARRTAETAASNSKSMAGVVRDLGRLFSSEELDYEQTDEAGNEFQVTGYDALEVKVNFSGYTVVVRNKSRRRKAGSYYFDERHGLSEEVFAAIEALFMVELTRYNTPRRVHDDLFDEQPEPGVPEEIRAIVTAIMEATGATGVMVRGPSGYVRVG